MVSRSQLVVGDIVSIEAGMRVPADCILIEGMDIKCDESMYQEGLAEVKKDVINEAEEIITNPDPFLLCRSLVMAGSGRAIVCAVGKHTRWFKENPVEDLEDDDERTPLQQRLELLANSIESWAYKAALLIFAISIMYYLIVKVMFGSEDFLSNSTLQKLLRSFTTAVAIIIVAVPEGLPLAV